MSVKQCVDGPFVSEFTQYVLVWANAKFMSRVVRKSGVVANN
jgi:hypothetical protein